MNIANQQLQHNIIDDLESEEEVRIFLHPLGSPSPINLSNISQSFIEVIHHPHSGRTTSTIIPIDMPQNKETLTTKTASSSTNFHYSVDAKPWAPFRRRADFEFAKTAVTKAFDRETIETLLTGINGRWASNSQLSFINYSDYRSSLGAARHFGVKFESGEVSHTFKGRTHTFKFQYRDPWKWLLDIVTDPTLSDSILWYPVEKYLNQNRRITRIYDELNTGTRWWEIQDSLPREFGVPHVPHCFLALHLWLDKSNVAKTVTKHPIILRPGFLPSAIRNASGNGGGVLIMYMNIVGDPSETAENEDDTASSVEVAKFKREVYHKIHHVVFRSIRHRSRRGEAVICGDKITRVLHPGFLIHAVDGEEAYCLCGTRGVKANFPCPRCLIYKTFLQNLTEPLVMRTQQDMKERYKKALTLKGNASEKLLRDAGLHLVKNAFWSIENSDPYLAYSYDMLHAFDSGEWGKHQWPLLLDHLTEEETENDGEEAPIAVVEGDHWKLGSPLPRISAREWETAELEAGNSAFRRFESNLTKFLNDYLPADDRPMQPILVR
ncbi:hypothetical protein M422DRAFT_148910 [Sphaerobolus stellatus SS14]|nr:hypothetical protein M422DRAFT_148910 [Sphaerobolus stellatus SS14]